MPLQIWVAIIGLAGTVAWCVLWWAFQRHVARIDEVVKHLHEPGGRVDLLDCALRASIAKCVTSEDLDLNMSPVIQQLENLVQEGRDREDRILGAVAGARSDMQTIQGNVQTDIRTLGGRIDGLYTARGHQA